MFDYKVTLIYQEQVLSFSPPIFQWYSYARHRQCLQQTGEQGNLVFLSLIAIWP